MPEAMVRRFDVHQRIQHGLVASSFTGLVLTGWPLRAAEAGLSATWVEALGGAVRVGLYHRIFAAVLIFASLYHLAYVAVLWRKGKLSLDMVPGPRDLIELVQHVKFNLGLRSKPAEFGRYTYWEKFDYWAVFWGMAIIGLSGLVLWFPVLATKILPGWSLPLAHIMHGDEALLALLAIFIWHFYNGHFREHFFPMNWVFLTGKLPAHIVKNEYPRWWARLQAEKAAAAKAAGPDAPAEPEPELEPVGAADEARQPGMSLGSLLVTGGVTGVLLGAIALWIAIGFGLDRIRDHAPLGTLGPGWGGAGEAGDAGVAMAAEKRPERPDTRGALRTLEGLKLDTMDDVAKLACFKTCHTTAELTTEKFDHKRHAGNDLECAMCHKYQAHERVTLDEGACKECH